MSKNERWELVPGEGAAQLEEIAENMRLWQRDGWQTDLVKQHAELLKAKRSSVMGGVIRTSLEDRDLLELLAGHRKMPDESLGVVTRSALADASQSYLTDLKRGPLYDYSEKRAAVSVIAPGVKLRKLAVGDPRFGYWIQRNRDAETGASFEGNVTTFSGNPEYGGRMRLEGNFSAVVLTGLVSPVTLAPRVSLEIFQEVGTSQ